MDSSNRYQTVALIPWLYLSLGLVQAAHSVEEVSTRLWLNMTVVTTWLHTRISIIPILHYSGEFFAAANLVIVAVILALSPFVFLNRMWAFKVVSIVAVAEVVNGFIHIVPAIVKGGYHSGCISAVFLLLLGTSLLIVKRKTHGSLKI